MKAHRDTPPPAPFVPVVLTLESQHEVDALYAMLNHPTVTDAVELPYTTYQAVVKFRNEDNSSRLYKALGAALGR